MSFAITRRTSRSGRALGRLRGGFVFVAAVCGVYLAGCAGDHRQIVASPLSIPDQQREIAKIVPLGTDYETARKKLAAAGIECSPSDVSKSGLWCVVWNRQDGKRWILDVKLLFSAEGRLYQMQQGQSDTGQVAAIDAAPSAQQSSAGATQPRATASGSQPGLPDRSPIESADGDRGSGSRTPFGPRGN